MEFPHGHHHRHHRRDDDDEREEYPPPGHRPPSAYDAPPPPQVTHVYHTSHEGGPPDYDRPVYPPVEDRYGGSYNRPPPVSSYHDAPPPPQHVSHESDSYDRPNRYSPVEHVSHESGGYGRPQPHVPSFFHHPDPPHPELVDKPSFRVYTKADPNFSLTIRDGKVILAPNNPSDPFQQWHKDEKYSTKVKDQEGFPSFALVNKAAGLAIKHSIGASHPVQLVPYDPSAFDESILWTAKDVGDGYRAVRMVNNIGLNFDAWDADKSHGGIRDGTIVALWEWWKGDNVNQRWKIVPY